MSRQLKEYRILKEIPGMINPVDTFVKEEVFHFVKDKKELSAVGIVLKSVKRSDVVEDMKKHVDSYMGIESVIVEEESVEELVDLGFLEVYEDKFLS